VKKLQDLFGAIFVGAILICIGGIYLYGAFSLWQMMSCDIDCEAGKRRAIWEDCIADEYAVSTCDALLISIGGE